MAEGLRGQGGRDFPPRKGCLRTYPSRVAPRGVTGRGRVTPHSAARPCRRTRRHGAKDAWPCPMPPARRAQVPAWGQGNPGGLDAF